MSYQLVLTQKVNEITKDVGENVFLDNLPSFYKVYLFYYPADMPNEQLEARLRALGNETGENLLVNIGRLNDPNFDKIIRIFEIKEFPVITVTAISYLASVEAEGNYSTAYVRIDNKTLLNSVDSTIQCIQRLFALFLNKKITEALNQAKHDKRDAIISRIKGIVANVLREVGKYFSERDISIALFEGKFEIKRSADSGSK